MVSAQGRGVPAGGIRGFSRRSLLAATGAFAAGAVAACTSSPAGHRPAAHLSGRGAPTAATGPSGGAGPTTRGSPGGPAREITAGTRTRPEVALTFHGAGDRSLTLRALAIFGARHAQVTVLAVGTWLQAHPDLAARITGAGHELGNHTYSHKTMPELAEAQARAEIERCRDLLVSLTGSPGRWFRPSGTPHATPLILRLAGAAGYPVSLSYDVDPLDYADPGAAAVRRRVAAAVRPGSVVSLHLGHAGTVTALPGILADLAARGLAPVTMSRLVAP